MKSCHGNLRPSSYCPLPFQILKVALTADKLVFAHFFYINSLLGQFLTACQIQKYIVQTVCAEYPDPADG